MTEKWRALWKVLKGRSGTCLTGTCLTLLLCVAAHAQPAAQPKLVLAIVADQFRYDYLTRFRGEYRGGLKRLLEEGAVFTNARYRHFPAITAPGHSTILTGATPALSGITGNDWYDFEARRNVTSIEDSATQLLGAAPGTGSSPHNLLQSSLGDELKMSGKGGKVIAVSYKDRSSVLLGGRMADAAYWIDEPSGNFVSSTWYFRELPEWATQFNRGRPGEKFAGAQWLSHKAPPAGAARFYTNLEHGPWGNELIHQFTLRALAAERLGAGRQTDLLAVSYSGNDAVGHDYGPDSAEVHDMALRLDRLLGELIAAAEAQAGAGRVVVLFTSDHGMAPLAETARQNRMPGGRLDPAKLRDTVENAVSARFGAGPWVLGVSPAGRYLGFFLDRGRLAAEKLDPAAVEGAAARALAGEEGIFRVYTAAQLSAGGGLAQDSVGVAVRNGFYAPRSPDVIFVPMPYWYVSLDKGTHQTPFDYDTHVPLIMLGPGIARGRFNRNVTMNDVAPTLATLLDIETPSGSVGQVLDEILK
jgi:type I phosphodiesterase/nucleotide pyrophosphatase